MVEPPRPKELEQVVVDTNVLVGAAFTPESWSGRIVDAIAEGRLRMPWTEETRSEARETLGKIPPISWSHAKGLYREDERVEGSPDQHGLEWIPDPTDRKFAALARDVGAVLISNDRHFLEGRRQAGFPILTSGEFGERHLS